MVDRFMRVESAAGHQGREVLALNDRLHRFRSTILHGCTTSLNRHWRLSNRCR
jgi:hypothetical protein